jgi:hypothetical protein
MGAHLEAVRFGDHDVEDDGVVVVLAAEPQGVGAGGRGVDRIALELERLAHERGHLGLVLDDQDAHVGMVRGRRRRLTHDAIGPYRV